MQWQRAILSAGQLRQKMEIEAAIRQRLSARGAANSFLQVGSRTYSHQERSDIFRSVGIDRDRPSKTDF